jgi:hypothetical protein
MKTLPEGDELKKLALELGIDIVGDLRSQSSSRRAPDYELQRRVIEAK